MIRPRQIRFLGTLISSLPGWNIVSVASSLLSIRCYSKGEKFGPTIRLQTHAYCVTFNALPIPRLSGMDIREEYETEWRPQTNIFTLKLVVPWMQKTLPKLQRFRFTFICHSFWSSLAVADHTINSLPF